MDSQMNGQEDSQQPTEPYKIELRSILTVSRSVVQEMINLDTYSSPRLELVQRASRWLFVGGLIFALPFGEKMNSYPVFGTLSCAVILCIIAVFLFSHLAAPLRSAYGESASFRAAYGIAKAGILVSPFHIPIWSVLTRQFPPDDFQEWMMWIVMPLLLLSLLGPMVPFLVATRQMVVQNKEGPRTRTGIKLQ